jgi:hypothetical protein
MLNKSANRRQLPNRRKADIALKIEPREWLPLQHALRQRRDGVGSSKLAVRDVFAWLRDGQLPSAMRIINSRGQQACALLPTKFWQKATFSGEGDNDDFARLRYHDPSIAGDGYIFVRADVFERLNTSASVPAPSNEPSSAPRRQRPGPPTTHDWFAIWSEILRRCLIALPKSENKLAEAVAVWYEDKYKRSVSVTEVRAAVKGICAALKENQSRSKTSQR